ncbi:lysophospholipase L1-like esterase [Streptococcus rupicaprae]|uniref:Lysophospholipase L1-like esterase n=1 Tax=Streptococcus rupicaprae TaxID=759619 RepID=A0ABV2FF64_9STRE
MRLLLLGDSLFARCEGKQVPHIEYSLHQLATDLSIENWAVSGDNSFDLLAHLAERELPDCDRVVVFIGANDLAQHKQVFLGEYQANLSQIVQELKKQFSSEQILLLTPAPVDERKQVYRTNRLVALYGEVVKKIACQEGVDLLDTVALFDGQALPVSDLLKGQLDDGVHFGSLAYGLLAEGILARFLERA